jgi:hypothetical protein
MVVEDSTITLTTTNGDDNQILEEFTPESGSLYYIEEIYATTEGDGASSATEHYLSIDPAASPITSAGQATDSSPGRMLVSVSPTADYPLTTERKSVGKYLSSGETMRVSTAFVYGTTHVVVKMRRVL